MRYDSIVNDLKIVAKVGVELSGRQAAMDRIAASIAGIAKRHGLTLHLPAKAHIETATDGHRHSAPWGEGVEPPPGCRINDQSNPKAKNPQCASGAESLVDQNGAMAVSNPGGARSGMTPAVISPRMDLDGVNSIGPLIGMVATVTLGDRDSRMAASATFADQCNGVGVRVLADAPNTAVGLKEWPKETVVIVTGACPNPKLMTGKLPMPDNRKVSMWKGPRSWRVGQGVQCRLDRDGGDAVYLPV